MNVFACVVYNIRKHQSRWVALWFLSILVFEVPLVWMPANETLGYFTGACFVVWVFLMLFGPWIILWAPEDLFPQEWDQQIS
jgi:hypothetical protein